MHLMHNTAFQDSTKEKAAAFLEMMEGAKNDPPLAPVGPYQHGQNGVFNSRDLNNPVVSAIMTATPSIANALPVLDGSVDLGGQGGGFDASFDTMLTGVTTGDLDTASNQPTGACDDGPVGGLLKLCSVVNQYGRYRMSTREVEIQRAGRRADRCDMFTTQLLNAAPGFGPLLGTPSAAPSQQNALLNEMAVRIWEMLISNGRMLSRQIYTGTPASNSGERKFILGLDIQINTGTHVDSETGQVCTAADPDVKDFAHNFVTGSTRDIVEYLEMAEAFVMHNATHHGANIDSAVLAINPNLFRELAREFAVRQYQKVLTTMNNFNNGRVVVDATQAQGERDRFINQLILPLNGRLYPVVADDAIAEDDVTTNAALIAGQYASDIYFIPTVVNGIPVSFFEMWRQDNMASEAVARFTPDGATMTSDGGRFRWDFNYKNGCLKMNITYNPRLRIRTPQYAFRIQNVAYEPLQHFRSAFPDSNYFADGGRTTTEQQQYYAPWSTGTPTTL